jgi:hypothetical protein
MYWSAYPLSFPGKARSESLAPATAPDQSAPEFGCGGHCGYGRRGSRR